MSALLELKAKIRLKARGLRIHLDDLGEIIEIWAPAGFAFACKPQHNRHCVNVDARRKDGTLHSRLWLWEQTGERLDTLRLIPCPRICYCRPSPEELAAWKVKREDRKAMMTARKEARAKVQEVETAAQDLYDLAFGT